MKLSSSSIQLKLPKQTLTRVFYRVLFNLREMKLIRGVHTLCVFYYIQQLPQPEYQSHDETDE